MREAAERSAVAFDPAAAAAVPQVAVDRAVALRAAVADARMGSGSGFMETR